MKDKVINILLVKLEKKDHQITPPRATTNISSVIQDASVTIQHV